MGEAATAVDYGGVSAPDWYGGAARRIAEALAGKDNLILAVHSGAGGFVAESWKKRWANASPDFSWWTP